MNRSSSLIAEDTVVIHGPPQLPLPADGPELPALVNYIRAGRCALFVGSGFSAPAGLPTWSELMQRLIAQVMPWAINASVIPTDVSLRDDPVRVHQEPEVRTARSALGGARFRRLRHLIHRSDPKSRTAAEVAQALEVVRRDSLGRRELERLLEQKRFPELAGYCREYLGRERFQAVIRQALRPAHGLPSTHPTMVKIPFACVVTTNFDGLIEEAYVHADGRGIPRAPTGAELSEHGTLLLDGAFFVLKAHGDLQRPETMIFTADDYRRVIHANPAFQALLSGILLTHAVLFVGYSLSDTNFRLLLDNQLTIFNGNVPPRFALLSGVESAEREILWRTAKLRALSYPSGQHQEVERFLRTLAFHFSPAVATRRRKSAAAGASSRKRFPSMPAPIAHCTLRIESQADVLTFELVRHHVDGSAERLWIGGSAWPSWPRVTALMARAALATRPPETSGIKNVRAMSRLLTATLPPSLRRKMNEIPRGQTLQLACSLETDCLPWEWLLLRETPLCLERPIVRSPVEVGNAARGFRFAQPPLRFLIIGDAGIGDASFNQHYALPGAEREAAQIAQDLRSASRRHEITRFSREEATRERFLHSLAEGNFDVIHFGGHAWFDMYESYIFFWDGVVLGSEIAPLLSRRPPSLLVLNTHYTAFLPYGVRGTRQDFTDAIRARAADDAREPEGVRGFTTQAMRCGITCFVGAFGSLFDEPAAALIVAFYRALLRGQTVGEALHTARCQTIPHYPATPLFYTVSGYPEFRLVTNVQGSSSKKNLPRAR